VIDLTVRSPTNDISSSKFGFPNLRSTLDGGSGEFGEEFGSGKVDRSHDIFDTEDDNDDDIFMEKEGEEEVVVKKEEEKTEDKEPISEDEDEALESSGDSLTVNNESASPSSTVLSRETSSQTSPLPSSPPGPMSRCFQAQHDPLAKYRAQCTMGGEYEPTQCDVRVGECWCVDREGMEMIGTRLRAPRIPACTVQSSVSYDVTTRHTTRRQPVTSSTDDIILEDNTVTSSRATYKDHKTTHREQKTTHREHEHKTTTTDFVIEAETPPDYNKPRQKYGDRHTSFLAMIWDPLVLAGIIGGAVLALLCIVLLIMFMIYRMRKKDEGSYVLDDSTRRTYDIRYTRTKDEEFLG